MWRNSDVIMYQCMCLSVMYLLHKNELYIWFDSLIIIDTEQKSLSYSEVTAIFELTCF